VPVNQGLKSSDVIGFVPVPMTTHHIRRGSYTLSGSSVSKNHPTKRRATIMVQPRLELAAIIGRSVGHPARISAPVSSASVSATSGANACFADRASDAGIA